MTEEDTKKVEIEMTLEEASDLFDKGWEPKQKGISNEPFSFGNEQGKIVLRNKFNSYQFIPHTLSQLANSFRDEDKQDSRFYSSGRTYFAKRGKEIIQICEIPWVKEEHWGKNTPNNYDISGKRGNNGKWFLPTYSVFSQVSHLNKRTLSEEFLHKGFEIPKSGMLSLTDASALPIWDEETDYESCLRQIYGDEKVDFQLKSGKGFRIISPDEISKKGTFFTTSLSPHRYAQSLNKPLCSLEDKSSRQLILKGTTNVPRFSNNALEGHLIRDYVQPQILENGVIVMNQDRIPKYLKRTLGLGEQIK